MKRSLLQLLVLTCLAFYSKNSFAVKIDSIFIFSQYHNTDSSEVFLDVKAIVSSSACFVQSISITDSLGFVRANICYVGGMAATTCLRRDTFSLGIKPNGTTNVLAIFKETQGIQCASSPVFKDSFELTINTGINNVNPAANPSIQLLLSPNPASSHITITIDETLLNSKATITDITGRKMAAVPLSTVNFPLSIANISTGVYFVTITNSEGKTATKKLVVSR